MARKKFTLARLIEPYRRKYIGLGSEEELNNFLNPVATSADLGDADADINTVDKYVGKPAYDTTLGEPVWASGGDPSDPWEQATGTGGGGGSPAGSDTEIQYNNAGSFGASSNFTFDDSTNVLNITGRLTFNDNTDNDTITAASVGLTTQSFLNLVALNFAPGFSGHFLETFVNGSTVVAGAHIDLTNRFPGTKPFFECNDLSAGTLFTIDASGYIGDYPGTPADGEVLTWVAANSRAEFLAGGGGGGLFSEDGNSNIIGGTGAGASITSGSNNFLGGVNAGNDIDSADRNIIIGNNALPDLDISGPDNIIIGANTVRGVGTATMQRNTIIGGLIWDSGVGTSFDCVVIGNQAMRNFQMGSSLHTVIGAQAGRSISNSAVGSTAIGQVAMGGQTGTPTLAGANNIAIGYRAMSGVNLAAAADNIAIGLDTLNALITGDDNIAMGNSAGTGITTGSDNMLIGRLAGDSITDGDGNIGIGISALGRTTGAGVDGNIGIGRNAGRVITSGEDNIFLGDNAGDATTASLTGSNNVFIGPGAGGGSALATAANNVAIGFNVGLVLRDGSENTILGHNAGVALRDGENNIIIGVNAGPTSGGQDVDSKLYIDITQTDTPLIEGDFVASSITINGDLNVTGSAPNALETEDNGSSLSTSTAKYNFIGFNITEPVADEFDIRFGVATASEVYCPGYPSYSQVSTTEFTIDLRDAENLFYVGRRVRFTDNLGAETFGVVASVDFNVTQANDTYCSMTMDFGDTVPATISNVCLVSSDTQWSPIAGDPFSGNPIRDIDTGQIGATQYWVIVGDGGRMAFSTDGGASWTTIATGTTEDLNVVTYNDDQETFWVGGDLGVLIEWDGTTVTLDTTSIPAVASSGGGDAQINGIVYSNTETAIFVLYRHTVAGQYRKTASTDNGATWGAVASLGSIGNNKNIGILKQASGSTGPNAFSALISNTTVRAVSNAADTTYAATDALSTGFEPVTIDGGIFYDSGNSVGARVYGCQNGNIRGLTGWVHTDTTTFTQPHRDMAWSPTHARLVTVGDNQQIGYIDAANRNVSDAWTPVSNGFSPLANILAVAWNDIDGVFVAVADNGEIARSSNGTN